MVISWILPLPRFLFLELWLAREGPAHLSLLYVPPAEFSLCCVLGNFSGSYLQFPSPPFFGPNLLFYPSLLFQLYSVFRSYIWFYFKSAWSFLIDSFLAHVLKLLLSVLNIYSLCLFWYLKSNSVICFAHSYSWCLVFFCSVCGGVGWVRARVCLCELLIFLGISSEGILMPRLKLQSSRENLSLLMLVPWGLHSCA